MRAVHWFPLLMLLGSIQFAVMGKTFFFPLYVPFIYLGLLGRPLHLQLRLARRLDALVLLYCVAALASLPYVTDFPKYAYGVFTLFGIMVPAYALGRRAGSGPTWSPRALLNSLIALSAAISVFYLFRLATSPSGFRLAYLLKLSDVGGMRSNTLVSLHVFGLVATLEALRHKAGWPRQLALIALLLIELIGGVSFNSRAYLLLMLVPVLAYLFSARDRAAWVLRLALALGLLALIARPPEALVSSIVYRWQTQAARETSWRQNQRVQIWARSLQVWTEAPFFGHGLGNSFLGSEFLWQNLYSMFTAREIAETPPEALAAIRPDGYFMAHNTVLQLLIEVGLVGAAVFLLILGRYVVSLRHIGVSSDADTRALARALLLAIVIAFVDGMVENNFLTRDFGAFFWFLMGATYSAERTMRLRSRPQVHATPAPTPSAEGRT